MKKALPADGVKGCIIYLHGLNRYAFRVYDTNGEEFVDYDIRHCDLGVTIDDPDAYLYTDGDKATLDHSPETLGLKIS